jgi:tRNA (mo5U34)-methyltransferase
MELRPGVVTPGRVDLRPVVDRLPWPEVRGKRCLDVGTSDGFYAFELERRGAAEVVATDIADRREWDWSAEARETGPDLGVTGRGFAIAHEALGSSVERREINVYDLRPEQVGEFDVVVCGGLVLHLRDPIRALEAMRSVCAGRFLSIQQVGVGLGLLNRRRPVVELSDRRGEWWIPTVAGHRRMVEAAGFTIERATEAFALPYGPGHPERPKLSTRVVRCLLAGGIGPPYTAVLARPRSG